MPIERHAISRSQFAELLGLSPERFRGVEYRGGSSLTLLIEPEEPVSQPSGVFPALNQGGKKPKGKGKRGC
jgi:hypothetical protein